MLVFSRHLVSAATIYDRAVASPGSLPTLERELGDVADFTFTGDAAGLGARLARAVRPLAPANLNRPPTLLAAEPQLGCPHPTPPGLLVGPDRPRCAARPIMLRCPFRVFCSEELRVGEEC